MNLNDINSGDPAQPQGKFFLNPICNNLSCNSLTAKTFKVGQLIGSGPATTVTSGSVTLSPSQLIGGVIGLNFNGNITITIPTAAQLTLALSNYTPPYYFTTYISGVVNVPVSGPPAPIVQIALAGTSIKGFNGETNFIIWAPYISTTSQNRWNSVLCFVNTGSGWFIYG